MQKPLRKPKDRATHGGPVKIMQCDVCGKMFAAKNINRPICCR